jgi:hypothetical protein
LIGGAFSFAAVIDAVMSINVHITLRPSYTV